MAKKHPTILEAAAKWPDSKAHAFQLGGQNPNVYYFKIDEPIFQPATSKVRCYVKCLKFDRFAGYLVVTNVPIKMSDIITDITIKGFTDLVVEKMNELLKEPELHINTLMPYETFGFYKPVKRKAATPKKTSEILQEPNQPFSHLKKVE